MSGTSRASRCRCAIRYIIAANGNNGHRAARLSFGGHDKARVRELPERGRALRLLDEAVYHRERELRERPSAPRSHQLDRLLSCMGYRLEVSRRPVVPNLTRSERRSWRLHCRLSIRLTPTSLEEWRPVIERNLKRLRSGVTGQPHSRNLDRWESLTGHGDVLALHRILTGLDRDSIEMREVSPMGGLLPQDERQAALQEAG